MTEASRVQKLLIEQNAEIDRLIRDMTALSKALDRIEKLEAALEALSHIHDGNPSDAYAGVPELDYARHMLWEARQIARKALEDKQ